MKRFAVPPVNVDKTGRCLDSPRELRNSRVMAEEVSVFRPTRWLVHLPLAILPFLAAFAIQPGAAPEAGTPGLLQAHWFWLVVAAGLGAWIGWYCAGEPGAGAGGQP